MNAVLDQLVAILDRTVWQERLVELDRCAPGDDPEVAIDQLMRARAVAWTFDRAAHTEIDRTVAERYLAVLLRYELAYHTERLSSDEARTAAALFIDQFGPSARFFASITLTHEVLVAKETRGPCGFGCAIGPFGSTLEEGLYAFAPAGVVGAVVIGDED